MDVRCGTCNKPFRVSDDKITGSGIKFICTRCGEYVKITREDFDTYKLSQGAVSALDLFEPKPKTPPVAVSSEAETVPPTPGIEAEAPVGAGETVVPPAPPAPADLVDEQPPAFTEPEPMTGEPAFSEPDTITRDVMDQVPAPEPEPEPQPSIAPEELAAEARADVAVEQPSPMPEIQLEAAPSVNPEIATVRDGRPETPAPSAQPAQQPVVEEPSREWKPRSQPEQPVRPAPSETPAAPRPETLRTAAAAVQARPATAAPHKEAPKKPAARPAPQPAPAPRPVTEPISASRDAGSNRAVLIIAAVVILLGIAGFGIYSFLQPSTDRGGVTGAGLAVPEGLSISNAAGSVETDGDLLITGTVVNSGGRDLARWYVVVDVFDAQGGIMTKLRMLNGRQIFTKREFDILAKRGVNVQELKAKLLQEQGAPVPAKGAVNFEIRYIQPPVGVASFNASLHPFNPYLLRKDIEAEVK